MPWDPPDPSHRIGRAALVRAPQRPCQPWDPASGYRFRQALLLVRPGGARASRCEPTRWCIQEGRKSTVEAAGYSWQKTPLMDKIGAQVESLCLLNLL